MKKERMPPRDSWIRLAPGKAVTLDERLSKLWHQKTRQWREVRGNILSACFELEYLLDNVLCEVFFHEGPGEKRANSEPIETHADARAMRQLFDGLFLKSGVVSFSRKIDILSSLLSEIRALQDLVPGELVSKLNKIRDVRNRFAHYPVTFTPIGDPPNQELRASLVGRDKELILDDKFFEEYNPLFSSTLKEMEELFKRLGQEKQQSLNP